MRHTPQSQLTRDEGAAIFIFQLCMAVLGLHCCTGFSICSAWAQQLWLLGSSTGSVVVVHGLSCSTACGILLEQGLNPCLLHWQADALPLNYQRSPSWNICLVIPVSPWLKAPTTLSIPGCCERVFIYLAVLGLGCGLQA